MASIYPSLSAFLYPSVCKFLICKASCLKSLGQFQPKNIAQVLYQWEVADQVTYRPPWPIVFLKYAINTEHNLNSNYLDNNSF